MIVAIIGIIIGVVLLATLINDIEDAHKYDKMSFREAMDLVDLPIVTFYQGEEKFNFLLDTGSNYSHISADAVTRLKGDVVDATTETTGVGDKAAETNGVIKANLTYKNKAYYDELLIGEHLNDVFGKVKEQSGVQVHGIIGNKFLSRNDYILDFEEYVAYSKKKA